MSISSLNDYEEYAEDPVSIDAFDTQGVLFHVSPRYLGSTVKFTPRIPLNPYEDDHGYVIEDSTTPRICVSKKLRSCFFAMSDTAEIDSSGKISGNIPSGHYVYCTTTKMANAFKPFGKWSPSSKGNPYGPNFSWLEYADENDINPNDNTLRESLMENSVPDANETNEMWILKPTTMRMIGQTEAGRLRLLLDIAKKLQKKKSK